MRTYKQISESMQAFDVSGYYTKIKSYITSASTKLPFHLLGQRVRIVNGSLMGHPVSATVVIQVDDVKLDCNLDKGFLVARLSVTGKVLAVDGEPQSPAKLTRVYLSPSSTVEIIR